MFRLRLNAKVLLLLLGGFVVFFCVFVVLHFQLQGIPLLLSSLLCLAVFAAFLWYIAGKHVLGPLAKLLGAMERAGKGDLSCRLDVDKDAAFQTLARSFNAMCDHIEKSYASLERLVSERTVQLQHAMSSLTNKANRLYAYSRNMAVISRLSSRVVDSHMSQDEILDHFMAGVTQELGQDSAMVCLVDSKRMQVDIKRDTGICKALSFEGGPLASDMQLVKLTRNAKAVMLPGDTAPLTADHHNCNYLFIPLLTRMHTKSCWETLHCNLTNCPAYRRSRQFCWNVEGTLCGNPVRDSLNDKLAYCLTCSVFPVIGALVVAVDKRHFQQRNRNISALRILASQLAASLENNRLHKDNQQIVHNLVELHHVTVAALSGLSMTKALDVFTDSARKFPGLDACAFWLLSDDGAEFIRKSGGCPDDTSLGDRCPERVPVKNSVLARAIRGQSNIVIEHDVSGVDGTQFARSAACHDMQTLLAIPLRHEGRPLGVFSVHKRGTMPFTETEVAAFMLLANQASMAIGVCMLNEKMKEQNSELELRTNLVSGILSSMSSGVVLLDSSGVVSLINEVGAAILHGEPGALVGRRLQDLYPETALFLQPTVGPYHEIEILRKDGTATPIGYSTNAYRGPAGETEGMIVIFRDLTDIKTLQSELLNKERFAAMGRVISGVAHEIRNPLFGISSIGQVLQRELRDPDHLKLTEALLAETSRMKRLIEELLQYGKPVKLNLLPCDLTKLWSDVIAVHRDELERQNISVSGDIHSLQTTARVDANQIRQVFLNLLRNALEASSSGGDINIRFIQEGSSIVFRISDNGAGIPDNDLPRIFDMFFTTKQKGTGLGLAICKKIIEDHGGTIAVKSVEGRGTAVTVQLPVRNIAPRKDSARAQA